MNPHKILFVDDDPNLLAAFQRTLRRQFNVEVAVGGQAALELLRASSAYALLVADMSMPEMDGVEFLEEARVLAPNAVRLMLTGNADQRTAVDAVNRGQVYRFLNKPCPPEILIPALESALNHYDLMCVERELLEGTLMGSVKMLSEVLGMVAPDALGRGQRLRESMRVFARAADVTSMWEMEVGALLASIGCASLPPRVIRKLNLGESLSREETTVVRRVPQVGHDLLVGIPRLAGVARIVLYQDQAFDGSGFPQDGCSGEHLPIGARMLKILNDRLILESDGVVKQAAHDAMKAKAGMYHPKLLDICFQCLSTFLENTISAERPVYTLFVKELIVDQIVVSDITTQEGFVLVGAGSRLTPMVLERLGNYDALGEVKQPVLVQEPPMVVAPPAGLAAVSA